jgi:hypothetical protein
VIIGVMVCLVSINAKKVRGIQGAWTANCQRSSTGSVDPLAKLPWLDVCAAAVGGDVHSTSAWCIPCDWRVSWHCDAAKHWIGVLLEHCYFRHGLRGHVAFPFCRRVLQWIADVLRANGVRCAVVCVFER